VFEIVNLTNGDNAEADTAEQAYAAYLQLKRDAPLAPRIQITNVITGKLVIGDR